MKREKTNGKEKKKSHQFSVCRFTAGFGGQAFAGTDTEEEYEKKQEKLGERHQEYVYGVPDVPTTDWVMSSGGRLYDNWMNALDIEGPEVTHPSWPASNTKKQGATTWRCKTCHGWDYKGVNGKYASGSYKSGIGGVTHMHGTTPQNMVAILRDDIHRYTSDMLSDEHVLRIGMFISRGLHDTDAYIDRSSGKTIGVASRGARIFQNICATCHGFQGTKLDWGSDDEPAFVGTEANANPWEVLHKIRNGHPGHEMVAMRPFSLETSVDILTYIRTLPEK
ncbi:MAG: hypothetical protein GY742_17380 [Hyphomicrobiales bacterium]|nr:hypothetical protein [Hyphomicrobiales bacterium]